MSPELIFKAVVVVLLFVIFGALTRGLFFLVSDRGQSTRTVRSLSWRIGLSIALFLLLLIGFATGLIRPHGVTPDAAGPPPAGVSG